MTPVITLARHRWWLLPPLLVGTALSVVFFVVSLDRDLWLAWSRVVPFGLWPGFNDIWITLLHLRQADIGADPLSDPTSEFAYPRAVLGLRHFGIHTVPAEWLGLIQGIGFTIAAVLVLRPATWRRAVASSLFLATPAILLGFERGNLDLALFALCAAAAWSWSRAKGAPGLVLPLAFMVGGAVLKLYPLFGLLAGVCAESSGRRKYWLLGTAVVCAYCYLIRADLVLIAGKIPVMTVASWGCLVFFARLEGHLQRLHADSWLAAVNWEIVALGAYGVAAVAAALCGRQMASRFRAVQWTGLETAYFWVGGGICCGCFAGSNFVYRWVFAFLTLPLLLRGARAGDLVVATWARVCIGALVVGLAAKFSLGSVAFVVVQTANWIFICGLIAGAVALRLSADVPQTSVTVKSSEEELDPRVAGVPAMKAG